MRLLGKGSQRKEKAESKTPLFEEEEKKGNLLVILIAAKANPLMEAISVEISEKITATVSKDSDLGKFEVHGEIFVCLNDSSKGKAEILMSTSDTKGMVIRPHPELNRALWTSQKIIAPKQNGPGFPPDIKLAVLKYKYSISDAAELPFNVVLWNSAEQKNNIITLEADFNPENPRFTRVDNLKLSIPISSSKSPQITKSTNSEAEYDKNVLEWKIERLDGSSTNATLEFETTSDVSSLFPIEISMSYPYSIMDAKVLKVQAIDTKEPITYVEKVAMTCDNYQIVYEL
jgi:hypothetical protein